MEKVTDFDVVVIGGSYAGLSAAMALGRSLRCVLVIDGGKPCNRQTPHSHNFLTRDGEAPADIAGIARAQVERYATVSFIDGFAQRAERIGNRFLVVTAQGGEFTADKLVISTGIRDILPDIPGFAECWGISVVHCPYCHGFENRGKRTGILANGEKAYHLASLVNNLTGELTLFTSGRPEIEADKLALLSKHGIGVDETFVTSISHAEGQIENLVLSDGRHIALDALYAAVPFEQTSDIPAQLGIELTEQGHIRVDGFSRTNISGVYACGDCCNMMRAVAGAVYSGNLVGAMVNKELVDDHF